MTLALALTFQKFFLVHCRVKVDSVFHFTR